MSFNFVHRHRMLSLLNANTTVTHCLLNANAAQTEQKCTANEKKTQRTFNRSFSMTATVRLGIMQINYWKQK